MIQLARNIAPSRGEMTKTTSNRFLADHSLDLLLLFIPAAGILHYSGSDPVWIFFCSALAIIPLAGWMGKATESLAAHLGAGIGALLNATFGNAAEMIIAVQGIRAGLVDVVKASITGSILGNSLLVLGLSALVGGFKFKQQKFNRTAASMSSTLMVLSAVGLVVPAIFHSITAGRSKAEAGLSLEISIVLFITYVLSLVFTLHTHKDLYHGDYKEEGLPERNWKSSILILLASTALIAWMSELLIHSVEAAAKTLGMTALFVGVVVVAVIGNAAEHSTAIFAARKNQMDLSFHIAIGSSMQIALFVSPLLVFLSYAMGSPMNLLFSTFEVVTLVLAVSVVFLTAQDGESNWMEGVLLLAVYVIFALAFFFIPAA